MDHQNNPMMITVVLKFKGQVNYDHLISSLEVIVRRFRRFRQRIVRPDQFLRRPYWEDDPHQQVEDHVDRVTLQIPADDNALMELVSRKMSTALDSAHPLWRVTLVDNYPQGSALIIRVHHCIADGISLMQVLLVMTQVSLDETDDQVPTSDPNRDKNQVGLNPAFKQTGTPAYEPVRAYQENTSTKPGKTTPRRNRDTLYGDSTFTESIAAFARIIFRRPDPPTIFKGPLGQVKKAVWAEQFDLPEIRKIARYKQATPNDVLMAVASGAIRRYMDLNRATPERNIRAFTMVNLRRRFLDDELGNKFGIVFLTLPLDREQPLEYLEALKQGMDGLKDSAECATTYRILNLLGWLPEWVEHLATRFLDTKGTIVATNVAGPRHQISLAGAPIQSIIAWVPQSGRIGVGLSFITYNNQVQFAINTDVGVVPDPEKLLELFIEEYKSYQAVLSAVSPEGIRKSP